MHSIKIRKTKAENAPLMGMSIKNPLPIKKNKDRGLLKKANIGRKKACPLPNRIFGR